LRRDEVLENGILNNNCCAKVMASIEQVMSIAVELLVKADRIILALFLLGCGAYELR